VATRIYLPASSAAPTITPAVGAGWTATAPTGFVRVRGSTTKTATALADHTSAGGTATSPSTAVFRQYIVGPLSAQTISGSITGVIRGLESATQQNGTVAINIRQVSSAGAHVNDLLAVSASDNTAATPPEFGTTAATRRFQDAAEAVTLTLTSRTFTDGQYLVIEIGTRKSDTSTTRTATLRFGDSAATDFAHTDGLTTDLNPWVEFSANLTFMQVSSGDAIGRLGPRALNVGVATVAQPRAQVSYVSLQVPDAAAGVPLVGTAGPRAQNVGVRSVPAAIVGRVGPRATDVGVHSTSVAATAKVGTHATTAGSQITGVSGAIAGKTGFRAVAVGVKKIANPHVASVGAKVTTAVARTNTSTVVGRVGAHAQTVGSQGITARAQVSWVQLEIPAASARPPSLGWVGPRAQNVGAEVVERRILVSWAQFVVPAAAPATIAGSVGPRAQTVGVKSIAATQVARAGSRAAHVDVAQRTATVVGRVGIHAATVGAQGGAKFVAGYVGSRAQNAGIKSITATDVARSGPTATTAGAHTTTVSISGRVGTHAQSSAQTITNLTGTALASVGSRAQDVGAKNSSGAVVGSVGTRGTLVGAIGGSRSTAGHTGARAQTAGVKRITVAASASVGTRSQAVATRTSSGSVLGRAGARADFVILSVRTAGVAGRAGARPNFVMVPQRSFAATITIVPRAQNAYQAIRRTVLVASVGTHAQSVAGLLFRQGALLGRVGARAEIRFAAPPTALRGTLGVRGQNIGGVFIAPPVLENYLVCEQDDTLDREVVWPVGVARDYGDNDWVYEPSNCEPPAEAVKPWEI